MSLVKHFSRNLDGRDLVVGDIHGCFTDLDLALQDAGFNEAVDRVFSVGDLIDRGGECLEVSAWLDKPWFHPVMGNHEQMAIMCAEGLITDLDYAANGGQWFIDLEPAMQRALAARFAALPVAIELETAKGAVGIVHAECVAPTWAGLVAALARCDERDTGIMSASLWSRQRIDFNDETLVPDVRAIVCGHSPVEVPSTLGNHVYIDTMGWHPRGHGFTVLDLATLTRAYRPPTKSESGL